MAPSPSGVSPANAQICAAAAEAGVTVTPRQLRSWRAARLLPSNTQSWPGGGGSGSVASPETVQVAVVLGSVVKRGTPISAAALALFAGRLPVPFDLVRAALIDVVDVVAAELEAIAGDAPDELAVAENVAAKAVSSNSAFMSKVKKRSRPFAAGSPEAGSADTVAEDAVTMLVSAMVGGPAGATADAEDELAELLGPTTVDGRQAPGSGHSFAAALEACSLDSLHRAAAEVTPPGLAWAVGVAEAIRTLAASGSEKMQALGIDQVDAWSDVISTQTPVWLGLLALRRAADDDLIRQLDLLVSIAELARSADSSTSA